MLSGVLGHDPQEQQYPKAQALPPLEVPPDLTGAGGSSALVVPGVDDGSAPAAAAGERAAGAAPPPEVLAGDAAAAQPAGPRIERGADGAPRLVVPLDFGRAWRTVGKAIEAAEMNVDDRDRSRGLYFVDYKHSKPRGRLARTLMFWAGSETTAKDRFLVLLQSEGDHTNVLVFDEKEKLVTAPIAEDILRKIQQNLE
ncbi:outer membrane protein assembly factor BamC [Immundisolibacter sp.]|uniref:outer membrane protein assembly factor BamC n=1 Tax=Immundisolibacter sp. TaxID=1934948 RepID=UPI00261D0CD9|nr:outer membrane protein assembly factor BamC [Immundisolibacter sp.]MDD3650621.1 outer membrane protein assembly factor BamC [Immundisolibacter sp.]